MALKVHGLAVHAQDGYDEWGVSGSLRLAPGATGRGLSASLTPSYGVDPGGSEGLWIACAPTPEFILTRWEDSPVTQMDSLEWDAFAGAA